MATSFDEIYSLNSSIKNNSDIQGKPDNIYYFLLNQQLMFAVGVFCEYSYIDLLDMNEFKQEIYQFDTEPSVTQYTLTPPPPENAEFYIEIYGVRETNYSFDPNTNILILPNGGEIYVGAYVIGEFNNTLTLKEKVILADAMNEWFIESKVNDPTALEQIMYAGVEMSSQAQHNKVNLDIEKFRNSKSFRNMILYTYSKNMPTSIRLAKKAGVQY